MIKNIKLVELLLIVLLLQSCFEDKSNYDYQEVENIVVTGIDGSYTKLSQLDSLNLSPTVVSSKPDAEYKYFWGIYETYAEGGVPKLDTISRTLNLKYRVDKPAKGWVIVFGAKNIKTGYTKLVNANLNVITKFTRGWYALKDDGLNTDMDLFLTTAADTLSSKVENVFSLINGRKLKGKAQSLNFETNYKSNVTGVLANTRVLFVTSAEDASIVNTSTMLEIRSFKDCFYLEPSEKSPNFIMSASGANYFLNAGKLHAIPTTSSNIGLFGNTMMRNQNNSPYKLAPFYLAFPFFDPCFFDETSSSFVSASGSSSILTPLTDAPGTAMPANNNNKTLKYLGFKSSAPFQGVALLQDKVDPNLKILSIIFKTGNSLRLENDTITSSSNLFSAQLYTANIGDEALLYFVKNNNELWSRNLVNDFEQLQFTAQANESITLIKHRKYTDYAYGEYSFNYIIVGVESANNYKVYMFNKTAGNLSHPAKLELTGTGKVRDIFYLSPAVSIYTYPNSF